MSKTIILIISCLVLLLSSVMDISSHCLIGDRNLELSLTPSFSSTTSNSSPISCLLNISLFHLVLIVSADSALVQLLISLLDSNHHLPGLLSPPWPSSNPSSILKPEQLKWLERTVGMLAGFLPLTPRQAIQKADTFWPLGLSRSVALELLHKSEDLLFQTTSYFDGFASWNVVRPWS